MSKKMSKTLVTILCFAMIATMSVTVFAEDGTSFGETGVTINPVTTGKGTETAQNIGNRVIGVIQVVGILISVGVLMVLGIKYMMGSAEEKAEYKKTFIPYIIGAIILFAASAFAQTLFDFAQQIGNEMAE